MPDTRFPTRRRRMPHGRKEFAALHAECAALLERAAELDAAQRALSRELAEVRSQLAHLNLVMWPRVDRHEIVHGFRVTLRGGPPPIPPIAPNAQPLRGRELRSAALAILLRAGRPMPLAEVHRQLHLDGYAIASRQPVQRLADALAYEITKGRSERVDRGIYRVGLLNPGEYRRLSRPAPPAGREAA
jgi:hypothetical protein